MKKNLHLITKLVFDPEYFYPERFIKIKTGDYVSNGLIVSNEEEELVVAVIRRTLTGDEYENEPSTQIISSEQVADGEIELIIPSVEITRKEILDKIYITFKETSALLCQKEHELADKNKIKPQDDIDKRNNDRLSAFRQIIISAGEE